MQTTPGNAPDKTELPPQMLSPEELADSLGSDLLSGLTEKKARSRLRRMGKNSIRNEIDIRFSQSMKSQCKGLTNLFLLAAMLLLYLFTQENLYLIGMGCVVLLMLFGAWVESRAAGALNVPGKYSSLSVLTVRNGVEKRLDSRLLVPGDLILLQKGCLVPADARLVEASGDLTALETPVSGERSSSRKHVYAMGKEDEAVSLNMIYAGTILTGGSCKAMVCRTGKQTLTRQIHARREEYLPPLLRGVREFCRYTSVACVIGCFLLIVVGATRGANVNTVFALSAAAGAASLCDTALSLALISFGNGLRGMAKDKLIVRNMDRVSRLARVNTVMCPKELMFPPRKARLLSVYVNGTIYSADAPPVPAVQSILKLSLVCSGHPRSRRPFEQVAYAYLKDACVGMDDVTDSWFRMDTSLSGDGEVTGVLALHQDKNTVVIKGAPENILSRCVGYEQDGKEYRLDDVARRKILSAAESAARENAYLVAVASGVTDADTLRAPRVERRMIFRGFLALGLSMEVDPASAVFRCSRAGIEAVVSTADPYYTAASIGRSAGIIENEGQIISSREIKAQERGMFVLNAGKYKLFLEPEDDQWQDVLLLRKEAGRTVAAAATREEELPLLREADVSAVPAAACDALRESSDLLLLENGFHVLANGITGARALCFRLLWLMQYLTAGVFTLFTSLLAALCAQTPLPMHLPGLLFGGLLVNLIIACALSLLPVDRKLLLQPLPPFSGRPPVRSLFLPLAYGLGSGICLTLLALLTNDPVCGMLFFLLSQFFYVCGCLWPEGAFRRKRFGYRLFWLLFPILALLTLALIGLPVVNTSLGFSLPSLRNALFAGAFALGWQVCVQVFLLARPALLKNKKKKEI